MAAHAEPVVDGLLLAAGEIECFTGLELPQQGFELPAFRALFEIEAAQFGGLKAGCGDAGMKHGGSAAGGFAFDERGDAVGGLGGVRHGFPAPALAGASGLERSLEAVQLGHDGIERGAALLLLERAEVEEAGESGGLRHG